jgi:hypothetical protein
MENLNKPSKNQDSLVKKFDSKNDKKPWAKILVICFVVGLLGLGSGLLLAKGTTGGTTSSDEIKTASDIVKGKTYGVDDASTFKDTAEGLLKEGGIEGEGQYHLERPGGETQYVYLTSSVVDLGLVKGRKIKVWGQTQKAQSAPWLMDVGKVEVLN